MHPLDFISGPSGGLAYHFAALRFRHRLWQPFISQVESWLCNDWNPKEKELIVFGPSAGWTLPIRFLERFERVVFVEPDPLARWLLRLRFCRIRRRFEMLAEHRHLPWFSRRGDFARFLQSRPNAAILFANLLGQISLLTPETESAESLMASEREFLAGLHGRSWASYHDVISARAPILPSAPKHLDQNNIEALAEASFTSGTNVIDHGTWWLTKNQMKSAPTNRALESAIELTSWQIRPGRTHVIGFVCHPPSQIARDN